MGTYTYAAYMIQTETVAKTGTYDIVAYGGAGGSSSTAANSLNTNAGGSGAEVGGNFVLQQGEVLKIVVGGAGFSYASTQRTAGAGGGGGASVVLADVNPSTGKLTPGTYVPLLIAGGGGGGDQSSGGNAVYAAASKGSGAGGTAGAGGTLGQGVAGGGGAGAKGNGYGSAGLSEPGNFYLQGGQGGMTVSASAGSGSGYGGGGGFDGARGGLGGGGGGAEQGGGGGGGYTGGAGGANDGGGSGGTSLDNSSSAAMAQSAASENTANSGNGKVLITPSVTCYVSGTLIRTARGDVAVEHLAVGDLVVTASGARRPIRWLGHRDTDCLRHPQPRKVWPVRVAAGALGAGLPYADLWLSPGHALCLQALNKDEMLIPVRCLVQGEAVMQVERERVTYWHVELDSHDILIANGVPAESYLDTGNRRAFDNAPGIVDLHPDFEAQSADGFCRPLVESGPLLSAARLKLYGAAKPVARTSSPVHMIADGTVLHGMIGDDQAVFVVPAGTRDLRLVSSSFQAQAPDIRTLGVVIGSLAIEAANRPSRTVAMDDPCLFAGFHEIETCDAGIWRWTDGEAHFAPSLWAGIDGAFILRLGGIFPGVRRAEAARIAA